MSFAGPIVVCALLLGSCASAPQQIAVAPPPVQPAAPQPQIEEPAPPPPAEAKPYEVSQEVYDRTFDEIRSVIEELNDQIARRDYEAWLTHLTDRYVRETSRPEYLDKWKDDPELRRRGVVLKTLKDFFEYRVVPTRSNVKLDEIQFLDPDHVYAFTVLHGEKYLLYYLVKTDAGWKVDFY